MHTDVIHKATFSGFEMLEHRDVQVHIVAGLQARVYISICGCFFSISWFITQFNLNIW